MDNRKRKSLDKDFVEEMVGEPVKEFSVSAGANKGDNVVGKMLALDVKTEGDEGKAKHLIIKSLLPLDGEVDTLTLVTSQFFVALEVFPVEIIFYKEVRPLLQQVTGYSTTKPEFFSAVTDGTNDYIALEDLRPSGYKMADKWQCLNLQEVTMSLKEVAKLHAHSYAVLASDNSTMNGFKNTVLAGHVWDRHMLGQSQAALFNGLVQKMAEILQEIGEVDVALKVEKFVNTGFEIMLDLWKKTARHDENKYFRTLIHGDLHTNNILFKYSDDGADVADVAFIDFQQCRFGNVYEDLQYFLFTSTTAEFRQANLKTCLQAYFHEFSTILLKDLNCPLPNGFSEEELISTFYENLEYGFCYNLVAIPFQLGVPPQGPPPKSHEPNQEKPSEQSSDESLNMVLQHVQMLKVGAKNSPVAIQRLKEMTSEMIKLNVLS